MSGSTIELALSTAVDSDDNADYLTIALANSLRTVDALFNNITGHNHASAHQGGPIATTSLKGAYDIPDWYRSTGHTSPYPSAGVGLELFYDATSGATVQGYNRATSAYAPLSLLGSTVALSVAAGAAISIAADRSVVIPGTLTMQGAASVAGAFTASTNVGVGGSIGLTTVAARINFASGGYIADLAGALVQINALSVAGAATIGSTLTVTTSVTAPGYVISALPAYGLQFSGAGTSVYADASMMQFSAPNLFRFNKTGAGPGSVDVTIGTLTNTAVAFVHNSSVYIAASQGLVVGGNNLNGQSFFVAGGAGGPTGWQTISNAFAKTNVLTIDNALALVMDPTLVGIHYTLTDPPLGAMYGFQAEPWAVAAPDVVSFDDEGVPHMMDYGQVSSITFQALKEYIAQTDARLAALEGAA